MTIVQIESTVDNQSFDGLTTWSIRQQEKPCANNLTTMIDKLIIVALCYQ